MKSVKPDAQALLKKLSNMLQARYEGSLKNVEVREKGSKTLKKSHIKMKIVDENPGLLLKELRGIGISAILLDASYVVELDIDNDKLPVVIEKLQKMHQEKEIEKIMQKMVGLTPDKRLDILMSEVTERLKEEFPGVEILTKSDDSNVFNKSKHLRFVCKDEGTAKRIIDFLKKYDFNCKRLPNNKGEIIYAIDPENLIVQANLFYFGDKKDKKDKEERDHKTEKQERNLKTEKQEQDHKAEKQEQDHKQKQAHMGPKKIVRFADDPKLGDASKPALGQKAKDAPSPDEKGATELIGQVTKILEESAEVVNFNKKMQKFGRLLGSNSPSSEEERQKMLNELTTQGPDMLRKVNRIFETFKGLSKGHGDIVEALEARCKALIQKDPEKNKNLIKNLKDTIDAVKEMIKALGSAKASLETPSSKPRPIG